MKVTVARVLYLAPVAVIAGPGPAVPDAGGGRPGSK
jgi:hypothetical protein